jgi:hypothetical protein
MVELIIRRSTMKTLSLLLLLFATPAFGQRHYLVSPAEEVLPLKPGDDARRVIENRVRSGQRSTQVCSDRFYFGYYVPGPVNWSLGANHLDVLGQWYVAKADGIIDTIFWTNWGDVGAADSTVYLRVHRSLIGPQYGPGIRPGPFDPPCQQWGYWENTNDPDVGIAAFPEDATDTTWHSTILGSPAPSTPPVGEILWGYSGYPVRISPNSVNYVAMEWLGESLRVSKGDVFFVSLGIPRGCYPDCYPGWDPETRTYFGMWKTKAAPTDEDEYPSRLWKFYEHDRGTACGGYPLDSIGHGWIVPGGFGGDSTDVSMLDVWYTQRLTSNAPPVIEDYPPLLQSTFDTSARSLSLVIYDCNPADPPGAGVADAMVRYSVNGNPRPDIPLADIGADVWHAFIPGQSPGSLVQYQVVAYDHDGDSSAGRLWSYRVVPFGTEWYAIDTGTVCDVRDIRSTGATVPNSSFFLPPTAGAGAVATDDGTSGPYDMGSNFFVFGDTFRYAWIGVNGAIALSKSPADTQDVNANGSWLPPDGGPPWDIPGPQKEGRGDSVTAAFMPGMYIAPFGADHIVQDSGGTYGRIVHGDDGDSCLFIVEWDSVGSLDALGAVGDITTFRVILDRCTGSVEFQYGSVGTAGLDSADLCGMQSASGGTPGADPAYVMLNRLGYPMDTRPRDNWCVRFSPTVGMVADAGWNMVSLPLIPNDSDFRASALFPTADHRWYCYPYIGTCPEELSPGKGYWIKVPDAGRIGRSGGRFFWDVSTTVADRWNLIGGPSGYVPAGSVVATGTTILSPFFGYGPGGYHPATLLEPGKAYWIRVDGDGTLGMTSSASVFKPAGGPDETADLPDAGRITFTDAGGQARTLYIGERDRLNHEPEYFDLPPAPPAGVYDVRFASQRWAEAYPGAIGGGVSCEFPVTISGARYPVTVRWDLHQPPPGDRSFVLTRPAGETTTGVVMGASGSLVIDDPKANALTISLRKGAGIPSEYSLGRNFPNPFNPVTVIGYSIPEPAFVSLKVFNLIGEEVATLVNEKLAPGNYSAEWKPADLPSGIYFCRLSAGAFTGTRKVVLMK